MKTTFRVYCEKGKPFYYQVYIFDTIEAMQRHFTQTNRNVRWQRGASEGRLGFEAIAQSWEREKYNGRKIAVRRTNIGQILFYAGNLGAGIVSHEMTHATTFWAHRTAKMDLSKLYSSRRIDERYAWVQGYLVAQFWTKTYRAAKRLAWIPTN